MEKIGACQEMMQKTEQCAGLDARMLELVAIGASIGSECGD